MINCITTIMENYNRTATLGFSVALIWETFMCNFLNCTCQVKCVDMPAHDQWGLYYGTTHTPAVFSHQISDLSCVNLACMTYCIPYTNY